MGEENETEAVGECSFNLFEFPVLLAVTLLNRARITPAFQMIVRFTSAY